VTGLTFECSVRSCDAKATCDFHGTPLCAHHRKRAQLVRCGAVRINRAGRKVGLILGDFVAVRPTAVQWRSAPAKIRQLEGQPHPVTGETLRHALTLDGVWARWWE